eukprot:CAMPEP_0176422424 /NCGR_PEP_ID=MMETSP0127-20121128/9724_1 /TAXON_ID=938130 /ORGANISM="Platyophrya macrostoma, Strain WH" /LENGTH=391 /DNA_ID=CAMNT_0017803269 /DNA_START=12 /DNA_END=1187 /DNA_ORIENTATION=-
MASSLANYWWNASLKAKEKLSKMNAISKKVRISVIKADLCPDREIFTKQHICCLVSFRHQYYKTLSHHFCGNNPVWEEEFSVCLGEDHNILKFELYNETTRDTLIAEGSVDLAECEEKKWIDLEKDGKFIGKLLVECFPERKGETHHAKDVNSPIRTISPTEKRDWMENNPPESLRDFLKHPTFVETRKEDEIKIAGLKNSTSRSPEHKEKKSVMSSIKDFVDKVVHKEKEIIGHLVPSKYKDKPLTGMKEDVPVISRSLSDMMSKPICVETPIEKETKIAGLGNYHSELFETNKQEIKSEDLTKLLDKASMKESKPEDSTKIAGIHNTPASIDGHAKKDIYASKEEIQDKKYESQFHSKTAHQIGEMMKKESFEEAVHQEGAKFGGLKNC